MQSEGTRTVTHFSLSWLWLMSLLTFSWGNVFPHQMNSKGIACNFIHVPPIIGDRNLVGWVNVTWKKSWTVIIFKILFSQWLCEVYDPQTSAEIFLLMLCQACTAVIFPSCFLPSVLSSASQSHNELDCRSATCPVKNVIRLDRKNPLSCLHSSLFTILDLLHCPKDRRVLYCSPKLDGNTL